MTKRIIIKLTRTLSMMLMFFSLFACSKPSQQIEKKNIFLENLASQENNKAYSKATKIINFDFPKDHGAHEDFKTEWWYFTGNLKSQNKNFGYQFTIFRNNIAPELDPQNAWETKNIYMGHMGLSDLTEKRFYSFERFERASLNLAGTQADPFKIWLNHWYIKSSSKELFPLEISVMEDGVGYKLKITPLKEKVLQGDKGLSQKSKELGNASYYYSYTRLETTGEIFIKDKSFKVSGLSWMDREWSTSALGKDQVGWDWFSLQLDDKTEVMIYQLRNKDGSIDEYSSGSFIDQNGTKTKLSYKDFKLKILEFWTSSDSEHKFPIKWSLELPKYESKLVIETDLKEQMHNFSIPYWEGAVRVSGSKTGLGYLEMTGY
jgi:predicted secreted hydrolase